MEEHDEVLRRTFSLTEICILFIFTHYRILFSFLNESMEKFENHPWVTDLVCTKIDLAYGPWFADP